MLEKYKFKLYIVQKYKKLMKMIQLEEYNLEEFLDGLLLEEFGQVHFRQNGATSYNVRISFGWLNGSFDEQ